MSALTRRDFMLAGAAAAAAAAFPTIRLGRAAETPIRRLVILMQENRSFDHYFGLFPGADGLPSCAPVSRATSPCLADLPHGSVATAEEAARGFARVGGAGSLTYYTGEDLPYYWALASRFTLCDRYFSSAPGATFPNRLLSIAGSSGGYVDNPARIEPARLPRPNLVDRLDEGHVDWACFLAHQPDAMYNPVTFYPERRSDPRATRSYEDFLAQAASGTLPAVSWVISEDPLTEHPPAPAAWGERFAALTINAIASGPAWRETAALLTYDEHGGFYDHVRPPGGHAAGFRVPAVIVSPYARPSHVSSQVRDHTSIVALVSQLFGLTPLGVPLADAFEDCFDFGRAERDFVAFPAGRSLPICDGDGPAWAQRLLSRAIPGGRPAPVPAARELCPAPERRKLVIGGTAALAGAGAAGGAGLAWQRRRGRRPAAPQ